MGHPKYTLKLTFNCFRRANALHYDRFWMWSEWTPFKTKTQKEKKQKHAQEAFNKAGKALKLLPNVWNLSIFYDLVGAPTPLRDACLPRRHPEPLSSSAVFATPLFHLVGCVCAYTHCLARPRGALELQEADFPICFQPTLSVTPCGPPYLLLDAKEESRKCLAEMWNKDILHNVNWTMLFSTNLFGGG